MPRGGLPSPLFRMRSRTTHTPSERLLFWAARSGSGAANLVVDDTPALEVDFRTPLYEEIGCIVQQYDPKATLLPALVVGATDARQVSKIGTKVYGFSPMIASTCELDRVHGHDERISIDALAAGTRILYDVVSRFCAKA